MASLRSYGKCHDPLIKRDPASSEVNGRKGRQSYQLQTPSPPMSDYHVSHFLQPGDLPSSKYGYAVHQATKPNSRPCSMERPRSRRNRSLTPSKKARSQGTSTSDPLRRSRDSTPIYSPYASALSSQRTGISKRCSYVMPPFTSRRSCASLLSSSSSHAPAPPSESSNSESGRSCYSSAQSSIPRSSRRSNASVPPQSPVSASGKSCYLSAQSTTSTSSQSPPYMTAISSQHSTSNKSKHQMPSAPQDSYAGHPLSIASSISHSDRDQAIPKNPTRQDFAASPDLISVTDTAISAYDSALESSYQPMFNQVRLFLLLRNSQRLKTTA